MSKSDSAFSDFYSPDGRPLVSARGRRFRAHCERIERENPEAARQVVRTIYDGCARLKDFPHLGRTSSRMAGRRELVFSPLPYIAVYRVTREAVEISRIFHGARNWPAAQEWP